MIVLYRKLCSSFEKFLPLIVISSFILGVLISDISSVSKIVFSAVDSFVEFYALFAPLVIFIILAPSLSQMVKAKKAKKGNFISYAISWLSFRRFLSLIWAVVFTWVVFDLSFYGNGETGDLMTSLKTSGKNLIFMFLTSKYFYAMYLAVAAVFIAQKHKGFETLMGKLLKGVEDMGQYLIPIVPVFMIAIGVYVSQLDTRLNDQIISGYDEQIDNLGKLKSMTIEIEEELAAVKALRAKEMAEPTSLKGLTILSWQPDMTGEYSMVLAYVLISLVIGASCMIWHIGLIVITKLKVKSFSIMKYFSNYWVKVYPLLWATSSEALATPLNLYLVKQYYPNVRARVRRFTIGVGSYLNINGTMICVIVLVGAISNILGIEITVVQLFLAIPIVFIIGFGVPGIPGELLLFAGPLLELFELSPLQEPVFLAMYLGFQLGLPDSFRTGNNSTDDCVMSILLNEEYESKFYDEDIFIDELVENHSFGRLFAAEFSRRFVMHELAGTYENGSTHEQPISNVQLIELKNESMERKVQILYRRARKITNLHVAISSPRCGFFRFRLLQMLEMEKSFDELVKLKENESILEISRHLRKLQQFSLVEEIVSGEETLYKRTSIGEEGINSLRALGRRVGEEAALTILNANFGINSIRLFLRAYSYKKESDITNHEIEFTSFEIASITQFLSSTIERISAIDNLISAEVIVVSNKGHILMNALKARAFFQYLTELNRLLNKSSSNKTILEPLTNLTPSSSQYTESTIQITQ